VAKVFSAETLEKFEAAAASIPMRPLERAFTNVGIRAGTDPGGPAGARRAQFRRFVATVDQRKDQHVLRLGAALGALIDEVATSKQAYLVTAAGSDGLTFEDGVFVPAKATSLDEHAQRLRRLAPERPNEAVRAAAELVASVSRTGMPGTGAAPKVSARQARRVVDAALEFAAAVGDCLGS
jgi:hypothetical protein